MDEKLNKVCKIIEEKFSPISIFLYGSRARGDNLEYSDYEIGVIYTKGHKIHRADLDREVREVGVRLYPFDYDGFTQQHIDTPFPQKIYFRELIESAQTLSGKNITEIMKVPVICTSDLLQEINFYLGRALAIVISYRSNSIDDAIDGYIKSSLYGSRCLVILQNSQFPHLYRDIAACANNLLPEEYRIVVSEAIGVRMGAKLPEGLIYKNISMLNFIRSLIECDFQSQGDRILLG